MDLFSLFLFTHENNEIKSPRKIYDFTVWIWIQQNESINPFLSKYAYMS